jgi:hypothetical protein
VVDRNDEIVHLAFILLAIPIVVWGVHYRWGLNNDKRKR